MTSILAKYISTKVLGETLENSFGKEDPYFETVPATRLDGKPHRSKTKKIRKALPPGISEHDGKILTKVKRRAYRLDMSLFSCLGIRFGWSSVIGIIPGIGDIVDAFMALMVLRTCDQIEGGLPSDVKAKMLFNIVVDFGIGLVPFLGDVADALFRANTKNAVVLEQHLRKKGAQNLKSHGQSVPAIDPTNPDEYDRQMRAENGPPPRYTPGPRGPQTDTGSPSQTGGQTASAQQGTRGGWFSGFRSKNKPQDVERGDAHGQRREGEVFSDTPRRQRSTLQKNRR